MKRKQKRKVAAYCRVSTKLEQQQYSLGLQEQYYRDLIMANPTWEFAGVYIDIASGTSIKHRPQFQAMIRACLRHKIDLILVKSVDRFGRNTLDVLKTAHLLKENGVDVFFEMPGFSLQGQTSELLLSLSAAIAQNYSEQKSKDIKWGIHTRFEMGESKFADKICYGYRKDNAGALEIHPEQAEVVLQIFTWYLQGDSLRRISSKLSELNIPSPTGKERWTAAAISKLLSNEKYIGSAILQKTYIKDFWEHTQAKNIDKLPKYLYENNNPPIITKEMFQQIQETKAQRSNMESDAHGSAKRKTTRYSSATGLSGKIKCKICGRNFRRITTHSGEVV